MSEGAIVPPALDDVTRRKVLGLVGLGARGRLVVIGVEQVKIAAQKSSLQMVIVAQDVSRHSLEKVVPVLRAR
ncbi:MAG: hypothetical protein ACOVSI_02005, partial [Gemmatimonas sp.]